MTEQAKKLQQCNSECSVLRKKAVKAEEKITRLIKAVENAEARAKQYREELLHRPLPLLPNGQYTLGPGWCKKCLVTVPLVARDTEAGLLLEMVCAQCGTEAVPAADIPWPFDCSKKGRLILHEDLEGLGISVLPDSKGGKNAKTTKAGR